jgi:hypothetical protein
VLTLFRQVLTPKEKKALKNAENAKKEAARDALNKQIKEIYAVRRPEEATKLQIDEFLLYKRFEAPYLQ